jgi:hypothetical protein
MRTTLFFLALLALAGCISEFIPKDIQEESGLLIVDGAITNGESVFTLSRSVGISGELSEEVMINHAAVNVESSDGGRIPATFKGDGKYVAQTGSLDANLQYRLSVDVDGETYQSDYLSPIPTAEIDSLFPMKKEKGAPVFICLTSHATEGSSRFFRWKYRETWEVRAELYADARWNGGGVIFHNLYTSENTYYCWGRDSSKTLLLGDTEKLSRNIISQQKIAEIPCDHDKLSILYHIEVEQTQVSEAAYRYFSDMQQRVERTGDLFSPVLASGLRGNIRCTADPGRMVIGYVGVSTTTRKDLYVWEDGGLYEPPMRQCHYLTIQSWNDVYRTYGVYMYGTSLAPYDCVDCRRKEKVTKDRPAEWPSDHL